MAHYLIGQQLTWLITGRCMLTRSLPHTRTTQSSRRTTLILWFKAYYWMKTGWYFCLKNPISLFHDTEKYYNIEYYNITILISYKRIAKYEHFPRYRLQAVAGYSDVKHDKTRGLRYLAGVLLGQGWAAYLIHLAGIPLNPLSVSESWPESQLSGQSGHAIRFLEVVLVYWVKR